MVDIFISSTNKGKLNEIRKMVPEGFVFKGLSDLGFEGEIPETGLTFEENARQKATFVAEKYQINCLSDDSGLEVAALGGAPGVYSARYAGPQATDQQNVEKLMREMAGNVERKARFVCFMCLIINEKEYIFEGELQGRIAESPRGQSGFGYDPVFIPEGDTRTLAEMTIEEKNRISHRAKAMASLGEFLKTLNYS